MLFIFELLRALGRARQPEPQNDLYNMEKRYLKKIKKIIDKVRQSELKRNVQ